MELTSISQVTVTLPHPGGERASGAEDARQNASRAAFESAVERRIAERAGDAQALAKVEAEEVQRELSTATAADAALRAVLPRIEQCPGAPNLDQVSVLLDSSGLFDAWVLVHERVDLTEPFLTCAGSVVWAQDWPNSPALRRFSTSGAMAKTR